MNDAKECKICGGTYPPGKHNFEECYSLDPNWDMIVMDNYDLIGDVEYMRNKISKIDDIKKEKKILRKVILCKRHLSSNQWGSLLEKSLIKLFKLTKTKKKDEGDCVKGVLKLEIKVSLGDKKGQINFVQIRPDHDIDYYLLMVYNLNYGVIGKLYFILIPSSELYSLLPEYGGYAHGTIQKLGKITSDNIRGRNCEYALRPNIYLDKPTKSVILWSKLLRYQKTEQEINDTLKSRA